MRLFRQNPHQQQSRILDNFSKVLIHTQRVALLLVGYIWLKNSRFFYCHPTTQSVISMAVKQAQLHCALQNVTRVTLSLTFLATGWQQSATSLISNDLIIK